MGNDGGSIPGRAELVKEKKHEKRAESDLIGRFRAKFCALTKERLRNPIAVCRLGYLYNYENLIKLMMERKMPTEFMHIRKVGGQRPQKDQFHIDSRQYRIDSNLSNQLECVQWEEQVQRTPPPKIYLNRFLVLWTCGCVFSEKILKDIKLKEKKCPVCNKEYTMKDIVVLGLTNEEIEMKRAKLLQEQQAEKKHNQQVEDVDQQVIKKVCTEDKQTIQSIKQGKDKVQKLMQNIMEKVGQTDELYQNSDTYKNLFHTEYKIGDQLFTRNVRFGLR